MGNLLSNPVTQVILNSLDTMTDEESNELDERINFKRRHKNRHRDRGYALREVDFLSDAEFQSMFRMNLVGFTALLALVSNFLVDGNRVMAEISSGSMITKETKLYTTLRFLAGGAYQDICFAWGIAKSTFFSTDPDRGVLWPTIDAIDISFTIGLPVHDIPALEKLADEFKVYSHGELNGCVTAIDGWVAQTRKPSSKEVQDVMAYRNRHDCWGIVVLAGCDARCRFTMFSCKNTGSTNDTIAWDLSDMKKLLDDGKLHNKFYLIGDEAFSCSNQLLVPYSGRGLGTWKDSFNYHLSRMRQCIERSFALLVNRWGILWRPLKCHFTRWTLVLTVCAKLHNFCLDGNIPLSRHRFYEDIEGDDDNLVILNEEIAAEQRNPIPNNRRAAFTRDLEEKGIRRPAHALINSRAL
jgi:hypothetical protein